MIIIDSDKRKPRDPLNSTKRRLKDEFDLGPGFAWITKGREVENYLDEDHLDVCLRAIHPSATSRLESGQWANLLQYKKLDAEKQKTASKVKIARRYVDTIDPNYARLDLRLQVNKLINFIRISNGFET